MIQLPMFEDNTNFISDIGFIIIIMCGAPRSDLGQSWTSSDFQTRLFSGFLTLTGGVGISLDKFPIS